MIDIIDIKFQTVVFRIWERHFRRVGDRLGGHEDEDEDDKSKKGNAWISDGFALDKSSRLFD